MSECRAMPCREGGSKCAWERARARERTKEGEREIVRARVHVCVSERVCVRACVRACARTRGCASVNICACMGAPTDGSLFCLLCTWIRDFPWRVACRLQKTHIYVQTRTHMHIHTHTHTSATSTLDQCTPWTRWTHISSTPRGAQMAQSANTRRWMEAPLLPSITYI